MHAVDFDLLDCGIIPNIAACTAWLGSYVAMRFSLVIALPLALASGCSAFLGPVSIVPSSNYASLSFRDSEGKLLGPVDGIWYVDYYRFKTPQNHVYIAQGKRSVGYQCPGWMSSDDFAALQFRFEAGISYEMVCEASGPVVYLLPRKDT